jgi:hypothetical protein
MIPAIATLSASRAYAASLAATGEPCTANNKCQSNVCYDAPGCSFDQTCGVIGCTTGGGGCVNVSGSDEQNCGCCMGVCKMDNKCK